MKDLEELHALIEKRCKFIAQSEPELINEAKRLKNKLEGELTELNRLLESVSGSLAIETKLKE